MNAPCFEIVAYTVANPASADTARQSAQALLRSHPGFIAWTALFGAASATQRVDLVTWASLPDAQAAAQTVATSPEFAAFRASVTSLTSMGHYLADATHPAEQEAGIELGRFRMKPGVDEAAMRAAYAGMIDRHLSRQPGWLRQHLIKLDGGVFVDLVYAETRAGAEALCASWQGQADCTAFLELIEPESMEFGHLAGRAAKLD